jgi:adenylosuccinate lyase
MAYQSPFSTRYGSPEMRAIWSEVAKRRAWRTVWIAVAEAQSAAGLVTQEQVEEIRSQADAVDLVRASEIEAEINHDLMAELRTFAEQCPTGGAVLHWGMTSADVQDNADIMRQKAALALLLDRLRSVLLAFAERIEETHDLPVLGYTHLQPAEPTTLGYRLSVYAQDLLEGFEGLLSLHRRLRAKGIRGPVGTSGPFVDMLGDSEMTPEILEVTIMRALNLEAFPVTTQTYPRLQDYRLICGLVDIAGALNKFAFDLRLLQSPGFGGLQEPFGEKQVGSSAMPFKINPVIAEKICSLARETAAWVDVAWQNGANSLLERTLDDSANRRSMLPEAFLACDEMLLNTSQILEGLVIDVDMFQVQLERFGPFAAIERVLTALVQAGADRQEMHERLRQQSMSAWENYQTKKKNPLKGLLSKDTALLKYLQPARIRKLLDASTYVGLAPVKAMEMAARIRERLAPDQVN